MYVHNVRLGFATNSSSSHSIVILRPGYTTANIKAKNGSRSGDYNFGWEAFRLVDGEEKGYYVIAQFVSNLRRSNLSYAEISATIFELFGVHITEQEFGDPNWPDISVDHQSVLGVSATHVEFWRDFYNFSQRDDVVIIGGNDNDGPLDESFAGAPADTFEMFSAFRDRDASDLLLRSDNGVWTMFNKHTGAKVRVSFTSDEPYVKASAPELVDLKLTNFCPFGCTFCYQSSTKTGIHAPKQTIFKIIRQLARLKVFEIAIGGGEPTMHPDFAEILKYAHEHNIVPNFTTYSIAWLKHDEIVSAVAKYAGGVGVSVHNLKDLEKVYKIRQAIFDHPDSSYGRPKVMAQHVIGTCSVVELVEMLDTCSDKHVPILFLGYKNVGFGTQVVPNDFSDFPIILKLALKNSTRWLSLSVDTAVLDQYPDILKVLEVSPVLATAEEGKFSCYIDAVTEQMAASSYAPDAMQPLPASAKTIKKLFATY